MDVMTDDTTRDLYWCAVLKFQRVLLLTTPSETVMEEVLDILESMCDDELVHEWGANLEEEVERQDIYEHHKEAQTTLAVTKADVVLFMLLLWVTRVMTNPTMWQTEVLLSPPTLWMVMLSPTMSSPISMDTSGHGRVFAYCTVDSPTVSVVVDQNSDL